MERASRGGRPALPVKVLICEQCGARKEFPSGTKVGKYCSRQCSGLAQRTQVDRTCEHCGKSFMVPVRRVKRGGGRYCSYDCKYAASRLLVTSTCAHCGKQRDYPPAIAKERRYCSPECQHAARRKGEARTCPCGKTFTAKPNVIARGAGKYCSAACRVRFLTRGPTLRCPRLECGREFHATPAQIKQHRTYCSRRCFYLAMGYGSPEQRTCQAPDCQNTFTVRHFRVLEGFGKYCSRECAGRARKQRRVRLQCAKCQRFFLALPSRQGSARYCSQRCYHEAKAPRRALCEAALCGREFVVGQWRKQRYCSIACANRSRTREHPEAERNAEVLRLHGLGFKAPTIQDLLSGKRSEWWMSLENIRQVVSRQRRLMRKNTRKQTEKRSVTLAQGHPGPSSDPVPELVGAHG